MSEQNSSDDSYRGEITSLRRVIEQLRLNLYSMEEQAALFDPGGCVGRSGNRMR